MRAEFVYRIKPKIKNGIISIVFKLPRKATISDRELSFFSGNNNRGFFRIKKIGKNVLEYSGPVGITLEQRLARPISKTDFLLIIAQIGSASKWMQKQGLPWNKTVWDLSNAFYNETTREIQLIYIPTDIQNQQNSTTVAFIESMAYSAKPETAADADAISRFIFFMRNLEFYDPSRIEEYILAQDQDIAYRLSQYSNVKSGFITDKRRDYYEHYQNDSPANPAPVNYFPDESGTCLINEEEEQGTMVLQEEINDDDDDVGGTALLGADDDEAETGLLDEGFANGGMRYSPEVHYPTLQRVMTGETIKINKPVFRIGKERSYVDYFVSNNNAVSRSHADIITRNNRCFVVDLNSKNRTYINGSVLPVQLEVEIVSGDHLTLANEEFIFNM